jgi:RNA polymerase sigma-70 factor (ECF subfamily)
VLADEYDRYGRFAYRLALSILRDPRLAEAAVEDAFVALPRERDRFGKADTAIFALVHRRAVEILRGSRQAASDSARRSSGDGIDADESHEPRRRRALDALDELPAHDRELILLAYFNGSSVTELAATFEQPEMSIHIRLRNAFGTLHGALRQPSES